MPETDVTSGARPFIDVIESAERRAAQHLDFAKKLRARLTAAKKALVTKPAVAAQVTKLVSDLQKLPFPPEPISTAGVIKPLEDRLNELQRGRKDSFASDLRRACQTAKLELVPLPDGFGVGPFAVVVNWAKETATLQYAKLDALQNVAPDANAIVNSASALKTELLDEPVDLKRVAAELREAMRVAMARQNKPVRTEMRVELPLVYQELALMRGAAAGRRKAGTYSLLRFVVELKRFIQSDQNLESEHQLRLETAVIEHTKNPKKSIFIPRDLDRAYGEGTYYQAIVST